MGVFGERGSETAGEGVVVVRGDPTVELPETGRGELESDPDMLLAADWAPETAGTEKVVCWAEGEGRCLTAVGVGAWGTAGVFGKLV